jgi:hypothetical protein
MNRTRRTGNPASQSRPFTSSEGDSTGIGTLRSNGKPACRPQRHRLKLLAAKDQRLLAGHRRPFRFNRKSSLTPLPTVVDLLLSALAVPAEFRAVTIASSV